MCEITVIKSPIARVFQPSGVEALPDCAIMINAPVIRSDSPEINSVTV